MQQIHPLSRTLTATRFCWAALGSPVFVPPVAKKGRRFGPDAQCWLCGGTTDGVGWPWKLAIPPTFTNHTLAAWPTSQSVCQPCVYLGNGDTWREYVEAHPEMGLKGKAPLSWRSYSHVFSAAGHECPQRARWRELLLNPPEPPFLFCIAQSGQKHLLFRAAISYDRDVYAVQLEEELIVVNREQFTACLTAFEALYHAGFSKQSILDADYHPLQLLKVGSARWYALERALWPFRVRAPALLRLAHHCAQRQEEPPDA